ncbi:MAG TPA: DUF447 domain-containing protein [Methylophilaceae bacterium]|nr:DUF447 domain-containing protein [Methylophilaceae bacterium]HAJ71221.1 DUF447 domain-containing protein [Methylophilaceae bacterium]
MIYETIISTVDVQGQVHVTPFGIRKEGDFVIISPYKPSATLDNILSTKCAVMNLTDDVRVFASAIVREYQDYLLTPAIKVNGYRLANTLAHQELVLVNVKEDEFRPELRMQVVYEAAHQAFSGFNRAQAAVIELAVLVSRLHLLPKDKVLTEKHYLQIAIDKTAGAQELQAWRWLEQKINTFYLNQQE